MSRIHKVREQRDSLLALLHDLEGEGLRLPGVMTMTLEELALAERALELLNSDAPMQDTYPDGKRAHPPYTPKQVFLLARTPAITHEQEAHQALLSGIQDRLGRREKRRCATDTKKGKPCRGWGLAYPPSDVPEGFRVCGPHAQPWEREHNREMRDIEEDLLSQGLALLGERRTDPQSLTAEDVKAVLSQLDFP